MGFLDFPRSKHASLCIQMYHGDADIMCTKID